ncbi:MAG: cytochrome c [Bacteroidetes bacterium]|nr:cytochrome c [Bacteroidota bacterium]
MLLTLSSYGGKSDSNSDELKKDDAGIAEVVYKANPATLEQGHQLYITTCAPYHGQTGKGDGPAAANLNPKPRDHTNGAYMSKLTDDRIGHTIKKGGAQFGYPGMPAQPQLKEDEINALLAYVRSLAK